jgi:aspartate/methionine/tyrosine aminotransferase
VIKGIADLAHRYGVTVVVDELYARLVHEGEFVHLAAQPGMFERTVTLLGPSKTESLSGYRLGVVVAPSSLIHRIEDVLTITSLRAPAYAQHVLVPWMRQDQRWLTERLAEFKILRDLTARELRRLPWLKLRMQSATAYAWPDVGELKMPGNRIAEAILRGAGVLVSPGYQFGPGSEGHFRVCYARDEIQWTHALGRIVDVLDQLAQARKLPPVSPCVA